MYVITAIIVICVVLLFLRGLYLIYLDSIKEDISPPRRSLHILVREFRPNLNTNPIFEGIVK